MADGNPNARDYQIMPERFQLAEHAMRDWRMKIEQGVTREQVLNPGFWAHVSEKMAPYDEVRVHCDDGSVYGRLLVLECSRQWARVAVLEWRTDLTTADVSQTQAADIAGVQGKFEVKHRGPRGWSVLRLSDNGIVKEGIGTRAEAEQVLLEHAQAAGA